MKANGAEGSSRNCRPGTNSFGLVAAGFSRSREFLADRRAALAYGKEVFLTALAKTNVDGVLFEGTAVQNIRHELSGGKAFLNVFEAFRQFRDQPGSREMHQQLLEKIRETKPGWYDSHPTFSERFAAVQSLPDSHEQLQMAPATDLLTEPSQVEEQLTELLTACVSQSLENHDPTD